MKQRAPNTEEPFFLGNENQPEDCIDTGITRESFERAFRKFLGHVTDPDAQGLRVFTEQMDGFFKIADAFLRERYGSPSAERKRELLADYRKSGRLMKGVEQRLSELKKFADGFVTDRPSRRGPIASYIISQVDEFAEEMDRNFYDIRHSIELQETRVPQLLVKTLTDEFISNLIIFIENEFPDGKNRNILIAAAMVGARQFTAREMKEPGALLGRIPEKVSRAKKYYEKLSNRRPERDAFDPAGIVFPVLRARNKKQKSAAVEKKGARRDGKS